MTGFLKISAKPRTLVFATAMAVSTPALAAEPSANDFTDKPAVAQPVSFNGYSCDMVRAKVAESGITAAYAYARYMGMSSRDIARVRKACSV